MATETGYDVKVDIAKAKQYAEEITKEPTKTTHADKVRSAADVLSTSMQNMQQAKFPGLINRATDVNNAASDINQATLMLNKRDIFKSFFRIDADLLNKKN